MPNQENSICANSWSLVPVDNARPSVQRHRIQSLPIVIGRDKSVALRLHSSAVSKLHAEIFENAGDLFVRDLQSTNGTSVNAKPVLRPQKIQDGDVLKFGDISFRLTQDADDDQSTVSTDLADMALALSQFDRLMTEQGCLLPLLQPIVRARDGKLIAYELLGNSRFSSLKEPDNMFRAATQLDMETELSRCLRHAGMTAASRAGCSRRLFLNTHPKELEDVQPLIASLLALRQTHDRPPMTIEIPASAVADSKKLSMLRLALDDLGMGLAYEGFDGGESRLMELAQVLPDYLKFDISLIHRIHRAPKTRQESIGKLVQITKDVGTTSVAVGIESEVEAEVCRELGFDLFQGYYFGRPADPSHYVKFEKLADQ